MRLLEEYGAEFIPFSPLSDEKLPEGIAGLILGGGYPELFAADLEKMRQCERRFKTPWKKDARDRGMWRVYVSAQRTGR